MGHAIFSTQKRTIDMAKKTKKLGRPRKKCKYTKKIKLEPLFPLGTPRMRKEHNQATDKIKDSFSQFNPNGGDLGRNQTEVSNLPPRASESSYTFVCGNRVSVRNLPDELLNQSYDETLVQALKMRRQLSILESLQFNMLQEQRFRGLK
jgi:hypothetical protein